MSALTVSHGNLKNYVGEIKNGIEIVSRAPNKIRHAYWNCRCFCGALFVTSGVAFNNSKYHGCKSCRSIKICLDLRYEKFGRLQPVEISSSTRRGVVWKCLCDCGNTREVLSTKLREGKAQSCGCVSGKWITNDFHEATREDLIEIIIELRSQYMKEVQYNRAAGTA